MPAIGSAAPNSFLSVVPKSAALSFTSGSIDAGTFRISSSSASQLCVWILNSMVREALVASVACTLPPVSRHSRKESIVPNASLPASAVPARRRAPPPRHVVQQPRHLGPGEIGIDQQPRLLLHRLAMPRRHQL